MANSIVTVNVTQTVAPTPSTLQRTGAFVSQGATTLASGTSSLLTQLSDLTPLLTGGKAITSMVLSAGTVTVTTTAPHGFTVSDTIALAIAGVVPTGYNGLYTCTITGASTFTFPLGTSPGSVTTQGVYTPEDVSELLAMVTTFFAQGSSVSVYVLELGAGNAADGVTALTTYTTANPNSFYSYLVPRGWSSQSTFLTMLASFEATTSKTYFFVTALLANYTSFTALMKCAFVMVEAPSVAAQAVLGTATEFSCAAAFWVSLHYSPSATNKVTPFAFSYLYGVTPYPVFGNSALLATLKAAAVNVIGTGAEGGISNTILLWGTTLDGNDFTYWYSVDWVQINIDLALSNAIINGSNNPINPLYYNQDGINRLEQVAASTMSNGVTFGLVLNPVIQLALDGPVLANVLAAGTYAGKTIVNAVPFFLYTNENTGDYKIGKYAGLSCTYTTNRGFISIIFNVNVSQFPSQ